MMQYRNTDGTTTGVETRATYVEPRRSGAGRFFLILLILAVAIVGVLFATGFWSASVKGGTLPTVRVDPKEVVVGSEKKTVDVPKIETKKTRIDVPTVTVKDGPEK
jgi:hypothetical protein